MLPATEQSGWTLRLARLEDRPAIEALIERSARGLSRADYTDAQIEAAIKYVFGVDSDLIQDETYYVVEQDQKLIGCGGWSKRKVLFGGDRFAAREDGFSDPASDPAKIRAFFVDPDHARRGIARALLDRCEAEARANGFTHIELMSTLPGVPLYRAGGYEGINAIDYELSEDITLGLVPMSKLLS